MLTGKGASSNLQNELGPGSKEAKAGSYPRRIVARGGCSPPAITLYGMVGCTHPTEGCRRAGLHPDAEDRRETRRLNQARFLASFGIISRQAQEAVGSTEAVNASTLAEGEGPGSGGSAGCASAAVLGQSD